MEQRLRGCVIPKGQRLKGLASMEGCDEIGGFMSEHAEECPDQLARRQLVRNVSSARDLPKRTRLFISGSKFLYQPKKFLKFLF